MFTSILFFDNNYLHILNSRMKNTITVHLKFQVHPNLNILTRLVF